MGNRELTDVKVILELLYDGNVKEHGNLYVAYDDKHKSYAVYIKGEKDHILNRIKGIGIIMQNDDTYYVVLEDIVSPFAEAKALFELMGGAFRSMLGSFDTSIFNSYLDTDKTDYKYKIFNNKFEIVDEFIVEEHGKINNNYISCSVNGVDYNFVLKDGIMIEHEEL